jgi:hypothetical protein
MRKMKKGEILLKLEEITKVLKNGLVNAKEDSSKYSTEIPSQLAFEVGYLSGVIKGVLSELNDIR